MKAESLATPAAAALTTKNHFRSGLRRRGFVRDRTGDIFLERRSVILNRGLLLVVRVHGGARNMLPDTEIVT